MKQRRNTSEAYRAGRAALRASAAKYGTVNLSPSTAMREDWGGSTWKDFMRGWNDEKKAKNPRSRMATKKKKKKKPAAKRRTRNSRKAPKKKANRRPATKKRAPKKKKGAASHRNPSTALNRKLAEMKPGKWYDTKVSGVRMKVKRNGGTLTLRKPAKRSR